MIQYNAGAGYTKGEVEYSTSIVLEECQDHKNFIVMQAYAKNIKEIDIKNIKCGEVSLGYFIPSAAILSSQHNFYEVKYFQKSCDAILKTLISKHDSGDELIVDVKNIINDYAYICFSKDRFAEVGLNNNEIKLFFISLGILIDSMDGEVDIDCVNNSVFPELLFKDSKTIKIPHDRTAIFKDKYIVEILTSTIFHESNPLIQFFYLYQTMEVMIDAVLIDEYNELKTTLNAITNVSSQKIKEAVQDINDSTKEINRINKLVNIKCRLPFQDAYNTLVTLKSFATAHGRVKKIDTIHDCIYAIRNMVFHDYRTIGDSEKLKDINLHIFQYILHIVMNVKLNT
ncbi:MULTISPECIES: hypothetical protein [Aeromonas]|uniref:hypothetical protein n=1 Tax=Aeromonas TaxID=642 RepID=UPI003987460F